MSKGSPHNNGDKRNGFALARRPSSAVERAAPGARRIVSGMVADTLALANQSKTPKPHGKLLIVDDEYAWRELLRVTFKDEYDLLIAGDGPTAIKLVKQHNIGVIVTCLKMPGMDGLELLKRLKLLKPDIKVVIFTGLEDVEFTRRVFRLGGFDYIHKSSDIAIIRSAVRKAMHLTQGDNSSREVLNKSEAETPPVVTDAELEAWFRTGERYFFGKGVPKDYAEALKWYRRAAEQGHVDAQHSLAGCYHDGLGVPQNAGEAAKWCRKAAENGLAGAQFHLGEFYEDGFGVPQDYTEAVKWLHKAAVQGLAVSQQHLGFCYVRGAGVPRDYTEAAKWYRKAAEQGDAFAQYNLAAFYENGLGVPQDLVEAHKWASLAANNPNSQLGKESETLRVSIAERMSADEVREGERLYQEFRSAHK